MFLFERRYGPKTPGSIIDNCQLSDWPVRDMDKDRHLIHDSAFDVYERASYGHGCEIQPITDDKHKKCKYKMRNFLKENHLFKIDIHFSVLFGIWFSGQIAIISNKKSGFSPHRARL